MIALPDLGRETRRDPGARLEEARLYYLIRLASYLLILWAIVEKNLPRRPRG